MTLYRQLIIFTFVLFLMLLAGTWYAKLETTRSFLVTQLDSHAQDTATSLALSISPHVAENDLTAVEGMVNAVFDRGYYQVVKFTDIRHNTLIAREVSVKINNVPAWFVTMIPLITPEATADVMAGWKQAGSVTVKSHPGYAYATLWKDVLNMSAWFAICAIFVVIAGGLGLRILLRPLAAVEKQADALCRKEYSIQEPLPWTKDFRTVVLAMNRMTHKVKEMFDEQIAQAERLREHAYHDQLTGLGNRRYFDGQITAQLNQHDMTAKGCVLLLRIHELETLNKTRGFQAGDELLKRAAVILQEATCSYGNSAIARLTGGDFGVYIPNAAIWDAEQLASELVHKFSLLAAEKITVNDNIVHAGAAAYDGITSLERLLAEADLALGSAMQKGPNCWELRTVTEETDRSPLGQQQWKGILVTALKGRRIRLDAQPVFENMHTNKIMHLEIFSRIIQEDGNIVNAALFMPIAERLQLVSAIDRLVVEEVLKIDFHLLGVDRIALNLSPASLQDESFQEWIHSVLQSLPPDAPVISFEFSEFTAVQQIQLVRTFAAAVRNYGHGIGLDHYGQSFSKLGYLQSLRPEYVKIDRAYTGELMNDEKDSRFYISSLCSVAHSIDIAVVAEGVESEQQLQILKELHLDGMQGYYVGRPQPITTMVADCQKAKDEKN